MSTNIKVDFIGNSVKNSDFFCSLCDYPMHTYNDFKCRDEFNCCHECFLKYVECRKKEWKEGWRPDKKSIKEYTNLKKQISQKIINIKKR